jgi:hypothetical protein
MLERLQRTEHVATLSLEEPPGLDFGQVPAPLLHRLQHQQLLPARLHCPLWRHHRQQLLLLQQL